MTHLPDPAARVRREPHPHRASTPTSASTSSSGASSSWTSRSRRSRRSATTVALPRRLRPALERRRTSSRSASRSSARRSSRCHAVAPEDAHPAGGDHRDRLRGLGRRRDPRDVEGHAGDRAPQGDARRQHPLGHLAGARRRRRSSTRSSGVFHYIFRERFLLISHERGGGGAARLERPVLGLPLLHVVRLRRDVAPSRSPACSSSSAS